MTRISHLVEDWINIVCKRYSWIKMYEPWNWLRFEVACCQNIENNSLRGEGNRELHCTYFLEMPQKCQLFVKFGRVFIGPQNPFQISFIITPENNHSASNGTRVSLSCAFRLRLSMISPLRFTTDLPAFKPNLFTYTRSHFAIFFGSMNLVLRLSLRIFACLVYFRHIILSSEDLQFLDCIRLEKVSSGNNDHPLKVFLIKACLPLRFSKLVTSRCSWETFIAQRRLGRRFHLRKEVVSELNFLKIIFHFCQKLGNDICWRSWSSVSTGTN